MGLTYSSVVDAAVDDVFPWHTRPGAVMRLTPPWPPVRVVREVSGPGSLRDGRAVFRLTGGLRWIAEHQLEGALRHMFGREPAQMTRWASWNPKPPRYPGTA